MTPALQRSRGRRLTLHGLRVALFVAIIAALHAQHRLAVSNAPQKRIADVPLERLKALFPTAASLGDGPGARDERDVLDASGGTLGHVLQTSPDSDHIIGFSGPTNVLVAFDPEDRIVGIEILSSGDTRDHVKQVLSDTAFLSSFTGVMRTEASTKTDVDVVSGATLTTLAIHESIVHRLGGMTPSLRFPDALTPDAVRRLFPAVARLERDEAHASLWRVTNGDGRELGTVLRTSPHADSIIGYQGPTDTLLGFNLTGKVIGISVHRSYDNEPYVTYVREDEQFLALFGGMTLNELAHMDLVAAEVEGVSGATMTSRSVAEGLVRATGEHRDALAAAARSSRTSSVRPHDLGTGLTILTGLVIGLTRLRANRLARVTLRIVIIAYLGLTTGTLLSQAMLVGWAQNGIPWRTAPGLVLLSAAAFLVPLTSRRNTYCSHLCPHGAAQQLLRGRLPWRFRIGRRTARALTLLPALLLVWCVALPVFSLPFSLIDVEPFDAWILPVAGWATITIAIVGLVASLFVPMAYCRYGCPTGALLDFLRLHPRSDRWTRRDWFAVGLASLAVGITVI